MAIISSYLQDTDFLAKNLTFMVPKTNNLLVLLQGMEAKSEAVMKSLNVSQVMLDV